MAESPLFHGSPVRNLTEILPGKKISSDCPYDVFASLYKEIAALFTLSPDTIRFMVDIVQRRIYIPEESDFKAKDQGGNIYQVIGKFKPGLDQTIFEFSAPKAKVISSESIPSADHFLTKLGYSIFADSTVFQKVVHFWHTHYHYPVDVPGNIKPINK